MNRIYRLLFLIACVSSHLSTNVIALRAAEDSSEEIFEKEIRPALIEHCIRCHGPKKQQGGLRLDTKAGWASGGDSGPAIVPRDQNSLLLEAIRYESGGMEMPPKGKLPEPIIEAFQRWVQSGATDPRGGNARTVHPKNVPTVEEGRQFWSFRPITTPPIPQVRNTNWPRNSIDRFILAKLEANNLNPTADAAKHTLLRRLSYDLTGLPPTPNQIQNFLADNSPQAYRTIVDELLESQHFGERWGRHWLDVVRFAESSGGGRTLLFPDAWRYRDYVIEAFNHDLPYNEFLRQQIAGDLLDTNDWQQRRRNLIATAFLLLGPTNYEMQDKDILQMDVVDEQLDTLGKALMGMTIGCARCHDHKFDPIPTRDYYALAGILKSTHSLIHSNVSRWNTVNLPESPDKEAFLKSQEMKLSKLKSLHEAAENSWKQAGGGKTSQSASIAANSIEGIVLDDIDAERRGEWTESTSISKYVGKHYIHDATQGKGDKHITYRPKIPTSGRYEVLISYSASANRSTKVPVRVQHRDGTAKVVINQRIRPDIDGLLKSLGSFEFEAKGDYEITISTEGSQDGVVIADAVVLTRNRGDASRRDKKEPAPKASTKLLDLKAEVDRLAAEVNTFQRSIPRRAIAMATKDAEDPGDIHLAIRGVVHQTGPIVPRGVLQVAQWESSSPAFSAGQSGRAELAAWLADDRHPLTARVMANRIWHWMMGKGIVASVDNFGSMGEKPTHPELLEHLASSLRDNGWSVKNLIREIALSRTYQLESFGTGHAENIDPENRLYWRRDRKRLRAEDIRDSMLLVSGELDLKAGGPGIKQGTKIEYGYAFSGKRRSVYVPVFRNTLPEVFEVFDFADPNIQRGQRSSSTVPSQSLWLMNHPFVISHSRLAARQIVKRCDNSKTPAIDYAYLQVLGRRPTREEFVIAANLLTHAKPGDEISSWAFLYQTLFQCIDFRYLD